MDNGFVPALDYPSAPPLEPAATGPVAPAVAVAQEHATTSIAKDANPFGETKRRRSLRNRLGSASAALVALVAKFGAALKALLIALPNLKLFATAGTGLVSVAAYSLFFGWPLAAGFVVLLFVHEMGHVIALRREGIKASAPMFIPFLGAAIFAKSLGEDALAEARVGLAGPILGSVGAAVAAVIGSLTGDTLLTVLAYLGFFLNLFNLLPLVPLDGGRAMAAMAPSMWLAGFAVVLALLLLYPSPILLLILVVGGLQSWRRWQERKTRSLEQAAYYRVSRRNRMLVSAVYIGLIVGLAIGMQATHVLTSAGHSFGHL